MNSTEKLKEFHKDKHPGFGSYLECMTRAQLSGLAGFTLGTQDFYIKTNFIYKNLMQYRVIGFSSVYFTQKLLQKRLPYPIKFNILVSTIVGSLSAYKITSDRTKVCQAAWLAAEDKQTALSDI
jgi:TMEM141 protein family